MAFWGNGAHLSGEFQVADARHVDDRLVVDQFHVLGGAALVAPRFQFAPPLVQFAVALGPFLGTLLLAPSLCSTQNKKQYHQIASRSPLLATPIHRYSNHIPNSG